MRPLAVCACVLAAMSAPARARDWTPEVLDYNRPDHLEITDKGEAKDKLPDTRQQEFIFRNLREEKVPVLITFPPTGKGPFPAVLLVHALGSNRRQITSDLGQELTAQGFACVALDLPLHGDRAVKGQRLIVPEDSAKTYRNVVAAVMDIRQTIDFIKEREDLDADKGVPMVGYSLGAWFATLAGAADRRVSVLVLQGSGAGVAVPEVDRDKPADKGKAKVVPSEPTLLEKYPTIRPQIAIAEFAPRPILMQNGKKDPFIPEDTARNLYRLANPPKELRWYDCGHILTTKAEQEAAEWIKKKRDEGR